MDFGINNKEAYRQYGIGDSGMNRESCRQYGIRGSDTNREPYRQYAVRDLRTSSRDSCKRYEIKDFDGKTVGSFSIRKKNKVQKKSLGYSYMELSNKILRAGTPYSAGQAAASARVKIASLGRKLYTGTYDDEEIKAAIAHAKKMERAAKKRLKNMQEEELKQQIQKHIEKAEKIREKQRSPKKSPVKKEKKELSKSEIRVLMKKIQESLKSIEMDTKKAEVPKDLQMAKGAEIPKDLKASKKAGGSKNLPLAKRGKGRESAAVKDELELKRKKHRLEEIQEVMRADMEYLRTKLSKMEREQAECASNGISGGSSAGSSVSSDVSGSGVSLELGGVDMEVPAVDAPVPSEGGSVDVSV